MLGPRTLIAYLAGISIASIALGLLTDLLIGYLDIDIPAQLAATEEALPLWLAAGSALLLVFFAIKPLRRLLPSLGRYA